MLNVKKLQAIRDKILGVTVDPRTYGDLNSTVYLQQILDALLGTNPLNVNGNLNERIYLQRIRNAILGVADGPFGSLSTSIYLQQILNAFNGVTGTQFGSLNDNTYLDAIVVAAHSIAATDPLTTGWAIWYDFGMLSTLFQDAARTTPVTTDGQPIGGVTDRSGNSNHLTQNLTLRPTYKANIQNGKSVGRFDGSNDTMATAGVVAHGVGAGEFYSIVALKDNGVNAANHMKGIWMNGNFVPSISINANNVGSAAYWTAYKNFNSFTISTVLPSLIEFYREAGSLKYSVNGVVDASTYPVVLAMANAIFTLGYDGGANNDMKADMYELRFMAGLPSVALRQSLRNYLRTKWALP